MTVLVTGLRRCGKSLRLGWNNHPRHEDFTPQEEELIIRLHAAIGSRWPIIAQQLPGRTENDVKNCWNTKLRKKLSEKGIDHVTHKPFSQILADYEHIGGLPKTGSRIGSLNRDLKNSVLFKSDQFPIPQEGLFSSFNTHLTTAAIPTLTDPTRDSFFLNKNNHHYANTNSPDLLTQLQAIKFVTEASNIATSRVDTNSPQSDCSSSSSSASSLATTQVKSSQSFSWRDFLLEDPFLPASAHQKEDMAFSLSGSSSKEGKNEFLQNDGKKEVKDDFGTGEDMGFKAAINSFEASSSSSDSSWVEAMLDQQNNMILEFPGLLEESIFY
ncbi:hypothetical protein U1Q18_007390 [Sarracenia purpurea var. burkii]